MAKVHSYSYMDLHFVGILTPFSVYLKNNIYEYKCVISFCFSMCIYILLFADHILLVNGIRELLAGVLLMFYMNGLAANMQVVFQTKTRTCLYNLC